MPTIAQLLNPNRRKAKPRWPLHPPYTPKPGTDTLVNIDRGPRPEWMNHSVVDPAWDRAESVRRWHVVIECAPLRGTGAVLSWLDVYKTELRYALTHLKDAHLKLTNGHWDAAFLNGRGLKRSKPVAVHLVDAYRSAEAKEAVRAGKSEKVLRR